MTLVSSIDQYFATTHQLHWSSILCVRKGICSLCPKCTFSFIYDKILWSLIKKGNPRRKNGINNDSHHNNECLVALSYIYNVLSGFMSFVFIFNFVLSIQMFKLYMVDSHHQFVRTVYSASVQGSSRTHEHCINSFNMVCFANKSASNHLA